MSVRSRTATLAAALCTTAVATVAHAQQTVTPSDSARADSVRRDSIARGTTALRAVVVTGTRLSSVANPRLASRVDVVNTTKAPPGPAGAAAVLASLPGVSISNDQGTSAQPTLELRGFTLSPVVGVPAGVSVFLDGVRMNEPDAQEVNLDLLPIEAADHAELVRGPSALFGKNSLAGAINFVTKRGSAMPTANVALSTGSYGEREISGSASGARDGFDGYLLAQGSDETGYRALDLARTRQLFATGGHRDDATDVALSLLVAQDHIQEAGSLPESWLPAGRRLNFTGGDFFRPRLTQLSARATRRFDWGVLHANAYGRRNAFEQYNVNVSDANTDAQVVNGSVGATAELDVPLMLGRRPLTLSVGAEGAHTTVRYHLFAQATDVAAIPDDCVATNGLCEDARVGGDDAAAFAQALWDITSRFSMQLSARGDWTRVPFRDLRDPANDGTSTFAELSPKLGATYFFTPALRTYASIGSAFRAPAALELACASPDAPCPLPFSLGADPPLRPVVAWSGETGLDWSPRSGASITLSAYRTSVRDEIAFVTSASAAGYFTNIPHTRRDGIETTFEWPLGAGIRTFGSYTLLDATYRSTATLASALDGNVVHPGDRFPLTPRHRGTVGVGGTRISGTTVFDGSIGARAVSSSYFRGDEANRMRPLPGYVVTDLHLSIQHGHVTARAAVDNLLDRRYSIYGVYGENPKGPLGGPAPTDAPVERFVTPAYPRSVSVTIELAR